MYSDLMWFLGFLTSCRVHVHLDIMSMCLSLEARFANGYCGRVGGKVRGWG